MSSIIVKGAKVLLPKSQILENGVVVIIDGIITEILNLEEFQSNHDDKKYHDVNVVEANGLYLSPGFIDPHTHVSLFNRGVTAPVGNDANENPNPVAPYLRALDAVYHDDKAFEDALISGVTTIAITPGSNNVVAGQVVALKTKPGNVLDKMLKECVAMKISLGENPKATHGPGKTPATRMGIAYVLRQALVDADYYLQRKNKHDQSNSSEPFKRELGPEAMSMLLKGEICAKVHCHRTDDIVTATRICSEFGIKYTLDHCTEGHLVADYLGKLKAQCIVGPIIAFNGKYEIVNRTESTAAILQKAGAKVSLTTDHPVVPIQHFLTQVETVVSRGGLSLDAAFECITSNAAEAINLHHIIGKIEVGYHGDLVLLTGRPGEGGNRVEKTIIDGQILYEKEK